MLRDERGAVAVLTGLMLSLLVTAAALSVDVGNLIFRKRELQSLVDVSSQDAVRAVGDLKAQGCMNAPAYAAASTERNGFDSVATGNTLALEYGTFDATTKVFEATLDCTTANAVRLTATEQVRHVLVGPTSTLTASAIAYTEPKTTQVAGSSVARFNATTDAATLDAILASILEQP